MEEEGLHFFPTMQELDCPKPAQGSKQSRERKCVQQAKKSLSDTMSRKTYSSRLTNFVRTLVEKAKARGIHCGHNDVRKYITDKTSGKSSDD
jgi:hypothetical protein